MYLLQDGSSVANEAEQSQAGNVEQPMSQLSLNGHSSAAPNHSLVVFCQTELQPERATRWIQILLQAVSPQHVLVATSLPVRRC